MLGDKAAKDRLIKEIFHSFLEALTTSSYALNSVFRKSPRPQTVMSSEWAGRCVRCQMSYATVLKVYIAGRCSLLVGLRINSKSTELLE